MRTVALCAGTSVVRDSTYQGSRETRANSTGYGTHAALSSVPVCRAYTSEADSYRTFDEVRIRTALTALPKKFLKWTVAMLPRAADSAFFSLRVGCIIGYTF